MRLKDLTVSGGADPNAENDDVEYYEDFNDDDEISDESDNNENDETNAVNGTLELKQNPTEEINPDTEVICGTEVEQESEEKDIEDGKESDEEEIKQHRTGFHGLTPADFVGTNEKVKQAYFSPN